MSHLPLQAARRPEGAHEGFPGVSSNSVHTAPLLVAVMLINARPQTLHAFQEKYGNLFTLGLAQLEALVSC